MNKLLVPIIMGSESDFPFGEKIQMELHFTTFFAKIFRNWFCGYIEGGGSYLQYPGIVSAFHFLL